MQLRLRGCNKKKKRKYRTHAHVAICVPLNTRNGIVTTRNGILLKAFVFFQLNIFQVICILFRVLTQTLHPLKSTIQSLVRILLYHWRIERYEENRRGLNARSDHMALQSCHRKYLSALYAFMFFGSLSNRSLTGRAVVNCVSYSTLTGKILHVYLCSVNSTEGCAMQL